jgi:hypothetical protein
MMAAAPSVIEVGELVAARAEARHELNRVLGGPARWHHRRADQILDLIDRTDDALRPDVVVRWR